jgi:cytoskeletal protein CcmA (bactofilin family)
MALWKDPIKDPSMSGADGSVALAEPVVRSVERPAPAPAPMASVPVHEPVRRTPERSAGSAKESLIAADVTIEGKIEGAGHVRIAGRFKGDVNVEGNVTIEQGAHVTGQIAAATVIVSGEVHGNINASSRVELLETGVINGDLKAAILTVAAGSRMRGSADFGWSDKGAK